MLKRLRYILLFSMVLFGGLRAAGQIAMPDNVCIGETKHYNVDPNPIPGSTYTWWIDGQLQVGFTSNFIDITWNTTFPLPHLLEVQEKSIDGCFGPVRSGNVFVSPPATSTATVTTCNSYFWNGSDYTTSGTYTRLFPNGSVHGCDSTATLNLTINPNVTSTTDLAICPAQLPYSWNGTNYTTGGTYPVTLTSAAGCDSIATLNLTIKPNVTSTTDLAICPAQLPYSWNGTPYNAGGTYTFNTTSAAGCDSIATLNLTIKPNVTSTTDLAICPAQLPYSWNGNNYTAGGTYPVPLTSAAGCDSIATLNLTIKPNVTSTTDLAICPAQLPYSWNGNSYAAAGTYLVTLTSAVGCDSIATLNLTIKPNVTSTTDLAICPAQLPYSWNGNNYTTGGTYPVTLTSASGCDSIATLNLTIKPNVTSTTNLSICPAQLPYSWNGTPYNAGGTYTFNTTSAAGCDSIATLNLTIKPNVTSTTDLAICPAQLPYSWNGNNYTAGGTYPVPLTSAAGCDSIATLNLTIKPNVTSTTDLAICPAQLPYSWNGNNYTTGGTYPVTLTSAVGCDSIATLNLTIKPNVTSTTDLAICPAQLPYSWNGTNYTTGGTYPVTLTSAAGCDSIATLNLTIKPNVTSTTDLAICPAQLPYSWNGTNYTTGGTYPVTLTSAAGCDSIATLNLTIKPNVTSTTDLAICPAQLPYSWNGNNYTTGGTYPVTLTSASGCDSIATLNLTIKPNVTSTTNLSICPAQLPYSWNGTPYNAGGTYTFNTTSAAGCDSIATLNLTIKPNVTSTTDLAICPAQLPYSWNGNNYTTGGTYPVTLTSAAGCDSIATLNLTIKPNVTSTTDLAICPAQLPYSWNGTPYNAGGTYTFNTTSAAGCDSIATLNLTIKPNVTSTTDLAICPAQLPYSWNGNSYTSAGTYPVTLTSASGCDSIATLNLTVNPSVTSTSDITICSAQLPYSWNGTNYTTGGTYPVTLTSAAGCDSIATLNLTIKPNVTSTTDLAICPAQLPYSWNGTNYTTGGTYPVTLTSAAGCDSIATLNLTIKPNVISTIDLAICPAQLPYSWNGTNYTTGGTYPVTLTSAAGCDSIATLNLTIKPNVTSTTDLAICPAQLPYSWNGNNYTTGGTYPVTLTSAAGCDSIATLNLTIKPNVTSTTDLAICPAQLPYSWNGTNYTTGGTYPVTLTSAAGCDSIATLNLTIKPNVTSTTDLAICPAQLPYSWNGNNYTTGGTYPVTLTSAAGCDSIATLNLTVNPSVTSTSDITICSAQLPYIWNGNSYTSAGTYPVTLTSAAGCDSIATLNLTIKPNVTSTTDLAICPAQLPYSWNGTNYTTGGTYPVTLTSAAGCDSIATLNLTIKPNVTSTTDLSICPAQLPYSWNGNNYTTGGTYPVTLTSAAGCDSIATLNLTIKPNVTSTTDLAICPAQLPYSWNGNNYTTGGTYPVTLTSAAGCDSIATLNLTIKPNVTSTTDLAICPAQLPYSWNGNNYTTGGTYPVTLTSAAGCDSIATLNLTIKPNVTSTTDLAICPAQLPYSWNGTNYTTGGTYPVTLTSEAGCDSIATLNLTIKPNVTSTTDLAICPAQLPYSWNGNSYPTAGTYPLTLSSAAGCDSIATLNLTIKPNVTSTTDLAICPAQLPYSWNGNNYTTGGTYPVTLTSAAGCDSIATLNLTIKPNVTSTTDLAICPAQLPYNWNGTPYNAGGTYTFNTTSAAGCDSIATLNLTIKPNVTSTTELAICPAQLPYSWNGNNYTTGGTYPVTLTSAAGCDSIATLNLTIKPNVTSTTDLAICSAQLPYSWNGNNYTTGGTYPVTLTSASGCDSIATLNLTVNPAVTSTSDITICIAQLPYSWNGNSYTSAGTYPVTLTSAAGCDSIATLNLTIKPNVTSTTDLAICPAQLPYSWNGTNYTTGGTYPVTLTSAAGCDSIATLNLTIKPNVTSTTDLAICPAQLPYSWNGNNYTTGGTYPVTLTSAAGCDSIATLNLTIKPNVTSTTDLAICPAQLPYNWNGTPYNAGGTYTFNTTSAAGCDSIATLNLTIKPNVTSTTDLAICSAQLPYSWNGTNYTTGGTYPVTLTSASGCDSIATLNLTIKPNVTSTTNLSICPAQLPYSWNGTPYNAGGTYTFNTTSAAGCDSIATLNLTIKPNVTSTTDLSICPAQLPYSWNGNNYTTGGTYPVTLTSAAGCDSIATLNLTIKPNVTSTTDLAICPAQLPYSWNGTPYNAGGTYTYNTTSAAGCDSIATLNLTIKPNVTSTTDLAICPAQLPYSWNGNNYTTGGTYPVTLASAAGCDSIATLNLTVNPAVTSTSDITICSAQLPYTWNGNSYTSAGTYPVTLTSAEGCDSIATLNLTVNPSITSTSDITICTAQLPYSWNGNSYPSAGTYPVTLTSASGCDSIATLNLTVNPSVTSTSDITICSAQLPYIWNGNSYTSAGTYPVTLTSAAGCDSIATLNLTVNPAVTSTSDITICTAQLPYIWNGNSYTSAGTYPVTLTSAAGCDSIATLNLTVKPNVTSTTDLAICPAQLPYSWNGNNYTTGGTYPVSLTSAAGCDSIATLNLTIKPNVTSTTDLAICPAQLPYSWNGNSYAAAGTYLVTLTSAAGCDSIATLNLTIKPNVTSTTDLAICPAQLPYSWNGTNYTIGGTYPVTLTSAAGCDSIATLNLTVNPSITSTSDITICTAQLPYSWNGNSYPSAGTYPVTLTSASGCDSIATLNLTVNPSVTSTSDITICSAQLPYIWNGNSYTSAGTYPVTLTSAAGCDSIATLNLTVNPAVTSTSDITICTAQLPYIWNGNSYTSAGTYPVTLTSAAGCDSIATLNLTVKPNVTSTTDLAICPAQLPYSWNGNNYTTGGTYPVSLTSAAGCDSIATLNLTIKPNVTSTTDLAICPAQLPYSWNGNSYAAAGTYLVTLTSAAGCDSIATLNLTIKPNVTSTTDLAICPAQLPYSWNGTNYTIGGTYPVTLTSAAGCDSIATLNLTIKPNVTSTTDLTICPAQLPYSWNGTPYIAGGTYTFNTTSAAGCDSIATLNLTIKPNVTSTTDLAICPAQLPYSWNGNNYTTGGTYPVTLTSASGCDSIATLNLTVNPSITSTSDITICTAQLPYSWNGNSYTSAGTYPVTLTSASGCDSIATLNLTVNPAVTSTSDITICTAQLPYSWNGNSYPAAGTYLVTLTSASGCDSIATLNLTVNPAVTSTTNLAICPAQLPYSWNGNSYTSAGTYPVTLTSASGCDSIATLNLIVNPAVTSTTNLAICPAQLPYIWNGNSYPSAGTYPVTLTSAAGCDSIATLNLTVNPSVTSTSDITICSAQLPYIWNGNSYTSAGTYPVTLTSAAGCDSIATLNLTVNPAVTSTSDITICTAQLPYIWNGNSYTSAGTYPVTLTSAAGCDSIATLNLTVKPNVTSTTDLAICPAQLPYSWNGNNYTTGGTYPVSLTSAAGCDSIATLNLTIKPNVTSTTDLAICPAQLPYSWNGNSYAAAGTYLVTLTSAAGCDSIATLNLTIKPNVTSTTDLAICPAQLPYSWNGTNYTIGGTYPVTLTSAAGCDSIATLNLTIKPNVTSTTDLAICPAQLPYSWNGNNYTTGGTYPVTLTSASGCDSIATLNLTVNPSITSTSDITICTAQLPYSWNGNSYTSAGTYPVTLTSASGCDSIATLNLTVNPAVTSTSDITICTAQLPYSWNGNSYPAAGTYLVTLTSASGCDSIATLNLTVNPAVTSTTNLAICPAQLPYSWNGNSYTSAGTYPVTLTSASGCDSIATLNLIVNPAVTSTTNLAICPAQLPYIWNGNSYPSAGTYPVTLTSAAGCDSIATLNLTVNPSVTSTSDITVCTAQLPYSWNGNSYTAAGTYPVTLSSAAGCDSIATLNLTVNPAVTSTSDITICTAQLPYSWNGNSYPSAGTYPVTLTSAAGCDSIATLNLTVNPAVTSTSDITICTAQLPYSWNGNSYPAAGTYPVTLTSAAGCDSIATLNLTVNPAVTSTSDITICTAQLPYIWNGNSYTSAGTYPVTLTSAAGCDSIATLNLTVNPSVTSTSDITICTAQLPYIWNGNSYAAAGTYPVTLSSAAGCDSIATLNLTVNPAVTSTSDITICTAQLPYSWNGNSYTSAGTYPVTLTSAAGCDSIATLNLTVNPSVTSTSDITVCTAQLPYSWNGNSYTAAGTYPVTLSSAAGCDSIATLNLTVNPAVTSTSDITICTAQLPYSWNGNSYPSAGTYPVTLTSAAGCDSIATLNLTVNPAVTSTSDITICTAQLPYSWNGNSYPAAGTYPVTLTSAAGCDSIATLNLTVNPAVTSTSDITICTAQLPYSWNGNSYPAAGTYPVTLTSAAGCDSIATLKLTVNPVVTSTTNLAICPAQLPYSWNGNSYAAAGTYPVTLTSASGCDSIATLNLTVNPAVTSTSDITICTAELPYSWNGNSYTAAGTYPVTLTSASGCDSIATLNLTVNPAVTSTSDITICIAQLPYSWNGNSYTSAGTYPVTLTSASGCDSIATLNLTVNPSVTSTSDITICTAELPYSWNGNSYTAAGTYPVTLTSASGCDSIATLNLTVNPAVTSTSDITICTAQLPYIWNGNSYTSAGTYPVTLTSASGCDSIATLNLTVNPAVTSTSDITICTAQLPYIWNGNSYTSAGTYPVTLTSASGCDSIVTLNLTVNPAVTSTSDITICTAELPYIWNGNSYTSAGTYLVTLTSASGCDSIATLNLTVNPAVTSTSDITICTAELPYSWNGNSYPSAGTYPVTLTSAAGCDSIATLNLTVNPSVTSTSDITICTAQLPYSWNGNSYTSAGTYPVTLTSVAGCDSIATLNLTVNPSVTSTSDITICTAELPYSWNGNSYTSAGTYPVTLTSAAGCDSIATLNLTVNPSVTSTSDITICTAQLPYSWNGNSYTSAGTYPVTLTSASGCDSIATLNLTVNPAVTSTSDITICTAQLPYIWNGNSYPAAGTYPVTLTSASGCDSIATLNLTVNPSVTSTSDITICTAQLPYIWNGNSYPAAGTYPVTLTSASGCDSIATLNLTVNPAVTSTSDITICTAELPYSWNGNSYTAAGTYPVSLTSASGCDSIATLNLTVNPAVTSTSDITICTAQLPYSWNGNSYPAAGTYPVTLTSASGCDSIATLNLTVNPSITSTSDITICTAQLPYSWNGNSYTSAGTYLVTLTSASGCDSIATLNLTVNPAVTSTSDITICTAQLPYSWNGNSYPSAGTYPVTLTSAAGCDSIATLNLTVNPSVTSTSDITICTAQLPYSWNGNSYTSAGTYLVTLTSASGCDSIATLNLTVNPAVTSTSDITICTAQLPYIWNGNSYPATGTYPVTLTSASGCDSIATLNLTVNPSITSTSDITICTAQLPYSWNGNSYTSAGTYPVTLTSAAGCDSIATLNLTVNPAVTSTSDITICTAQLPYIWNGNSYTSAGTYPVTLTSASGCDSIATLNLTVNPAVTSTSDITICTAQLPYSWNGNSYPSAGTYPVTLTSAAGCDSIATLNLTVNPAVTSTSDITICTAQLPYIWNGNSYTSAGTYPVTLTSASGCDSIATLNLTVNPAVTSTSDITICTAQLPYSWNGNSYTSAGTYPVTLTSASGCDSIATLNLTVNPAVTSTSDITICTAQLPYSWNGNGYTSAGTYLVTLTSASGCDSIATLNLTVNPAVTSTSDITICTAQLPYSWNGNSYPSAGTYPVTLTSAAGCDSIATLNLTVNPAVISTSDITICTAQLPYSWNGNSYTSAGTYPVTLTSASGCDSIATLNLTVNPAVTSTSDITICTAQLPYSWNGNSYTSAGTYPVTLTSASGCDSIATLNLTVNPAVTSTSDITICTAQLPYIWNGTSYTSAGTYPVTLTSASGCDSIATLNLTVNSDITPTFNSIAPICSEAPAITLPIISLNGITGTWSPAFNNTATTLYTFTPAAGQCATKAELTVTVNPILTPTFAQITPLCLNSTAPILPVTSVEGITVTWSPTEINTAENNTTTYTFTPASGQCAQAGNLVIEVNSPIITTIQTSNSTDGLANGQATVIVSNSGSQSLTYSLDGNSWQSSNVFANLSADSYTAWVSNANGCITSLAFRIQNTVTGKVEFLAGHAKSCINVPFILPVLANGFTNISSFSIQLTFDPSAMSYNNYSQQNILLNTGTLSASVISPGVLQINFLTPGSISLQSDNLLLNLNFTALSSGKTDIVWNSFECVIYSASGDKVPAIYTLGDVDIKPAPQIETAGSGSYCEGTPLTLHASSPEEGIEFTWTRPDGTSKYGPNLNLEPLNPDASGEYTIKGVNKFSCSATEVVPVTVTPNPKPVFTTIGDICTGPVIITTETTYSEYNWLVGSTSPELQVDTAGLYWLTVTDNNNCKASDSIRIFCDTVLRNDELSIWLPNAFSPDGDQINDVFSAKITPDVVPAAFNMKIFNKWGEEIYSSDDITKGWDGTFKGKPCASDLYTYIVTFTAPDNYYFVQKSPQRGVVMLYK